MLDIYDDEEEHEALTDLSYWSSVSPRIWQSRKAQNRQCMLELRGHAHMLDIYDDWEEHEALTDLSYWSSVSPRIWLSHKAQDRQYMRASWTSSLIRCYDDVDSHQGLK